jgi:hypothetical protein
MTKWIIKDWTGRAIQTLKLRSDALEAVIHLLNESFKNTSDDELKNDFSSMLEETLKSFLKTDSFGCLLYTVERVKD